MTAVLEGCVVLHSSWSLEDIEPDDDCLTEVFVPLDRVREWSFINEVFILILEYLPDHIGIKQNTGVICVQQLAVVV